MPHVIAKITALDEIKKISQHILEFRNILALCPAIRILVQKPKIHAVRISPICILNCHAPYYTIFLLRLAELEFHDFSAAFNHDYVSVKGVNVDSSLFLLSQNH